jgi:hypothetical protein
MIINQFIKFSDKLYILLLRKLDDPSYVGEKLDLYTKWVGADKVLRKEGYLYFLEEVEEAQVIDWLPKEN